MINKYTDGLTNFFNKLANRRNPQNQNSLYHRRLTEDEEYECYCTGIGFKIISKKAGTALNDSLQFTGKDDESYYNKNLDRVIKQAAKWMVVYGRGLVVIFMPNDDLSKPLTNIEPDLLQFRVFSGRQVNVVSVDRDLMSPRYFKPVEYQVREATINHSRCIDFTYIDPDEDFAPYYKYGGISEFQLIYGQLINDGIVERASARIVEVNSNLFYKITGFKDNIRTKTEDEAVKYFSIMEDKRGIYGAGILDKEDDVVNVAQALTNLSEVDQISLRRIALVTGIPVSELVGESVRGLNSTGDNERTSFMEMIHTFQDDFLYTPINELMSKLSLGAVQFKEAQGQTPSELITYEGKVVEIATKLDAMGEDGSAYLREKKIIVDDPSDWQKAFSDADPKDHWVTVKSNSEHVLLGEGGEIKAGLGGKFTGQKISEIKNKPTGKTTPSRTKQSSVNNQPTKTQSNTAPSQKQPTQAEQTQTKLATAKNLSENAKNNPQTLISGGKVNEENKKALIMQYAVMQDKLNAVKSYEEFKTFKKEHAHTFKKGLLTDGASPNTCHLPGGDSWWAEKDMMSGYLDTVKVATEKGATLPPIQMQTVSSERKYLNRGSIDLIDDVRKNNYNGVCYDNRNIVLKRSKNDPNEVANEYSKKYKSSKNLKNRTITHEIGHTIDKDFSFKYNGKQYTTNSMMGLGEDFIKQNVSGYGKKNKRECMAECFSRYVGWKNGVDKKPSDFALAVAEGMLEQRKKE
ncbi:MAG: DUF1073 domain-containing protein [Deferribacteraceae bacterium]|jgi:hypothetical protein|nr:DUF1073 domain-containing protein [Deferribacteraceae bacterium]